MKTQYDTAARLEAFIATEDDPLDGLFPLGAVAETSCPAFIRDVGALAMGAATYPSMLQHVVPAGSPTPAAWPYTQPCWVFTHRALPAAAGARIRFVQGDLRPVHERMRAAAAGRSLWIVGGGDLAGPFHDAGRLDEIVVEVGSVTLGRGKPLLPRRITSPPLAPGSVRQVGAGFAELRCRVGDRPAA